MVEELFRSIYSKLSAIYNEKERTENDFLSKKQQLNKTFKTKENFLRKNISELEDEERIIEGYQRYSSTYARSNKREYESKARNLGELARLNILTLTKPGNVALATELYDEANAQLKGINEERDALNEKINELRVQFEIEDKQLDKEEIPLSHWIEKQCSVLKMHEVSTLIKEIGDDCLRYSKFDLNYYPEDVRAIGLGINKLRIPLLSALHQEFEDMSGGLFKAKNASLSVTQFINLANKGVYTIEYTDESESELLGGLQNLLVNVALYLSEEYAQILFTDPVRYNGSVLGCLEELSGKVDSLLDVVPSSEEELTKAISVLLADVKAEPIKKPRLIIIHQYSQAYSRSAVKYIEQLCVNAHTYNLNVIITHKNGDVSTNAENINTIKSMSTKISCIDGVFYSQNFITGRKEKFEWYPKPNEMPYEVRKKFIVEKVVSDTSSIYENRINIRELPRYRKGDRRLTDIAYGKDDDGYLLKLDFENSNFATFISGASRSGKSTMLHSIINGVLWNNHPDDVEIWLVDFKMTEFSRYVKTIPPHVRYIVLDESAEIVYDLVDRLTEILNKRQNIFKGKWEKLSQVPKEKYMPSMFVIIDEFSIMSKHLRDSTFRGKEDYTKKMETLLAKGAALGMHFIFASQGFTSGAQGLTDFAKKQVQQRIVLKTENIEIKETLDLRSPSDQDRFLMEQIQPHHALVRIPTDRYGNNLVHSETLYFADTQNQLDAIDRLRESMHTVPKFLPNDVSAYIDKRILVIDGNKYVSYASKEDEILNNMQALSGDMSDGDIRIYLGEPRRMIPLYSFVVSDSFRSNLLILSNEREREATLSVVLSVMKSLELQNCRYKLWAENKSRLYKEMVMSDHLPYDVENEFDAICRKISRIKKKIENKVYDQCYYFLLGFETFLTDMRFSDNKYGNNKIVQETYEKRKEGEMDLLTQMELGIDIKEDETENLNEAEELANADDDYNAESDLKYILANGPKYGYHFVLIYDNIGEYLEGKFDSKIFAHKVFFCTPKEDLNDLLDLNGREIVSTLPERIFRYVRGSEQTSFRPFLYDNLNWDYTLTVEEEDYLL